MLIGLVILVVGSLTGVTVYLKEADPNKKCFGIGKCMGISIVGLISIAVRFQF